MAFIETEFESSSKNLDVSSQEARRFIEKKNSIISIYFSFKQRELIINELFIVRISRRVFMIESRQKQLLNGFLSYEHGCFYKDRFKRTNLSGLNKKTEGLLIY